MVVEGRGEGADGAGARRAEPDGDVQAQLAAKDAALAAKDAELAALAKELAAKDEELAALRAPSEGVPPPA